MLRERGDQANSSKDIPGNESPALNKKPDSALEGEGQQERGTLPGDCRMVKRLLLGACSRGVRADSGCAHRAAPAHGDTAVGAQLLQEAAPRAGEITHLTQAFLRKGLALVLTVLMGNVISLKTLGIQVS